MASFEISYDADEDMLDVQFGSIEDPSVKSISLNENIVMVTDLSLRHVYQITFYGFQKLIEVSETEFSSLADLTQQQADMVINLIAAGEVSSFFALTRPEQWLARVQFPRFNHLVQF